MVPDTFFFPHTLLSPTRYASRDTSDDLLLLADFFSILLKVIDVWWEQNVAFSFPAGSTHGD
jgi:hypothetical protein